MTVSRETPFRAELRVALHDLGLDTDAMLDRFEQHWNLVEEWNRRTNLTAITEPTEAAWLHYRDSLEALALLPPGPIVDLGSGGGFPGIPLAIAAPGRPVALVEVRQKKCSFLEVCRARLDLGNVMVRCAKVESEPPMLFSAAVTRATFSDEKELVACLRWVREGGTLLAFRSIDDPPKTCSSLHRYTLRGTRLLAIWRRNR